MNLQSKPDQASLENSATQFAYNKLRDLILTGELAPNVKLKIDELKNVLGVGASPIREALSLLTSDQLVERRDQRGFRTAATSKENFQEILELRCALESMALRQSIQNTTDAWTEELVILHHRMNRALADQSDTFEQQHKNFHMALINNCQSPLLLGFCSQLYDLNIRYRYIAGKSAGYEGRKVGDEHKDILDTAIEGQTDKAVKLLISHYQTTGAYLSTFILT